MRKVLFLAIKNLSIQNFLTQLELMSDHIDKGDQVYVLRCKNSLPKCYSNFYKLKSVCFRCGLNLEAGMNILKIPQDRIFLLNDKITFRDFPKEFKDQDELLKFTAFNGVKLGFGVVSNIISERRDPKFDTVKYKDEIKKALKTSILVYESVYELLQKLKPDLFYLWNGRFFDVWPAIEACKKLGIEFYTYENTPSMSKYSLFKNCLPHDLENLKRDIEIQWENSELKKDEKEKLGVMFFEENVKRSSLLGIFTSMTKYQDVGVLPECFDELKMNIAIFNSSLDEYEAFDEYKNPIYKDENEGLRKIVESFKDRDDIQFYLRVHPNLKGLDNAQTRELKKIDSLGYKNLKIIWPEERIDSYALLNNCDKILVFHSTMGVETTFWGKPAILAGRSYYEDLDCAYIAKNHNEVARLIDSELSPKPKLGAIKYGHWMMTIGHPYKKYQPETISTGKFLGKDLWDDVSLKNKLKLKLLTLKDFGLKKLVLGKLKAFKRKTFN